MSHPLLSSSLLSLPPPPACVTSYTSNSKEYIHVRKDAKLDGSKPVSGGLAFCFPQFGPPSPEHEAKGLTMQQHGFARNLAWDVVESSDTSVTMSLSPSDYTKAMWDKDFSCTYSVAIGDDELTTKFTVNNKGVDAFHFQGALHSYFATDAKTTKIVGAFKGKEFLNKVKGEKETESRDEIIFAEEVDSVYQGISDFSVSSPDKTVSVAAKSGWTDFVAWNPFGDEGMGYEDFVCAESAVFEPLEVAGGGEWVGEMTLKPQ